MTSKLPDASAGATLSPIRTTAPGEVLPRTATVAVNDCNSPSIDGPVDGGAGVAGEDVGGEGAVAGIEFSALEAVAPTSRRADTATATPTNKGR